MDAREAERLKRNYAGADYDKARTVGAIAFCKYGDEHWTLGDFLTTINNAVATIPAQAREGATVDLESGDYETSGNLVIKYMRVETSEEVANRVQRCEAYVRECEAKDAAEYKRLKAKFDAGG